MHARYFLGEEASMSLPSPCSPSLLHFLSFHPYPCLLLLLLPPSPTTALGQACLGLGGGVKGEEKSLGRPY